MPIEIRRITAPGELTAVYRQRYAVYVEELKYRQRYANHVTRTIVEPLDSYGHILGAFEDGVLVGSARINFGGQGSLEEYVDLYRMRRFAPYFPERISMCTKFIVAPKHRSGTIGIQLSKACYTHPLVLELRTVFNLIDSKPPLDQYFRHLGYRQIQSSILHPDLGEIVIPLVLPTTDRSYLERIGSPFATLLPPGLCDDEPVRWFYKTFGDELAQYDLGRSSLPRARAEQARPTVLSDPAAA